MNFLKQLCPCVWYFLFGKTITKAKWNEETQELIVTYEDASEDHFVKADKACWSIWIKLPKRTKVVGELKYAITELYSYCTNYGEYPSAHKNAIPQDQLQFCHLKVYKTTGRL